MFVPAWQIDAADLRRGLGAPLPREHGGADTQHLLDGRGDPLGIAADCLPGVTLSQELAQPVGQQRGRRLVAGGQLAVDEPGDLVGGERLVAVKIDPRQIPGQVILGSRAARLDEILAVTPVEDQVLGVMSLLVDRAVAEVHVHRLGPTP